MKPSDREIYHFDLNGFIVLRGALSTQEVADLNATIDAIPELEKDGWHGHVHAQQYGEKNGMNLQQIYEAGEPFENLIDHPSWRYRSASWVCSCQQYRPKNGGVIWSEYVCRRVDYVQRCSSLQYYSTNSYCRTAEQMALSKEIRN